MMNVVTAINSGSHAVDQIFGRVASRVDVYGDNISAASLSLAPAEKTRCNCDRHCLRARLCAESAMSVARSLGAQPSLCHTAFGNVRVVQVPSVIGPA
jgi:hypothetical protein